MVTRWKEGRPPTFSAPEPWRSSDGVPKPRRKKENKGPTIKVNHLPPNRQFLPLPGTHFHVPGTAVGQLWMLVSPLVTLAVRTPATANRKDGSHVLRLPRY